MAGLRAGIEVFAFDARLIRPALKDGEHQNYAKIHKPTYIYTANLVCHIIFIFAADFDCVSEDQLEFQSTKVSNIMWHRQDKKYI